MTMDSGRKIPSSLQFFKVFLPKSSSQHMCIPPAFVKYFNGTIPRKAVLKDRDHMGKSWRVTLEEQKNCVFFSNGWQEFAGDHFLKYGDFLVFQYDGSRMFDVKIFGKNGCKKELVSAAGSSFPSATIKDEPHSEQDDSEQLIFCKRKHLETRLNRNLAHKSRRMSPTNHGELSTSKTEDHVSRKRLVFERKMRNWSRNIIYISRSLLVKNNISLKPKLSIIDEKGKRWPVTMKLISSDRCAITTGWSIFFREKVLEVNDKCRFEFVLDVGNVCRALNVKITRHRGRRLKK